MLGLNKARRAKLLGGTALTLLAAIGGGRAVALDECGTANPGDTVTCTPAGNPFPDGIQYKVNDLTIVVQDGIVIDTTAKAGEPGGVVSGGNGNYGDLVVKVGTAAGAGVTITTNNDDADGISVATNDGDATITSFADITTGFKNGDAISAKTTAGDITISSTGDLDVDGFYGHGIRALSDTGKITITHTGDIETYGVGGFGIRAITKNDISITVDGDMIVRSSPAILAQASAGDVTITFTGDINTKDNSSAGLQATAKDGTVSIAHVGAITTLGELSTAIDAEGFKGVTITSVGNISTSGKDSSGISASATDGDITITAVSDISTSGTDSHAIYADTDKGEVAILSQGDLSTAGKASSGILAVSRLGGIEITHAGDIETQGNNRANGIAAYASGGAIVISSSGNIVTNGAENYAIYGGTDKSVSIQHQGSVTTVGKESVAVYGHSVDETVDISVSGNILVQGEASKGIYALAATDIAVDFSGTIVTLKDESAAILADSNTGDIKIDAAGAIRTYGDLSVGILAHTKSGGVDVTFGGGIVASGDQSKGIYAEADAGTISVTLSGDVATLGKDGTSVVAYAVDAIDIMIVGAVQGGWSNGGGVVADAGNDKLTLEIGASGSIGSLNDRALTAGGGEVIVRNSGHVLGIAGTGIGNDRVDNSGTWSLRNFADMNGDHARDLEAVAFTSFGDGVDEFDNSGVLRLASVSGATAWDTTGQILHPGGGNADITQDGVEQGFLLNLETFKHSGLIALGDGVAGDLLVITDQADGKTKGGNVFTSNGGSLTLDAVLDDGSSKQSDVLILDKAETGTGATRVYIANAGGTGGQTTGDGILVVNVRDASDADAFVAGNKPVAGAYQYDLFYQNLAKTDENWYLRSSFFEGALEYPSISSSALLTWHSDLNGLHDRLGERRAQVADGQLAAAPSVTDVADASAVRLGDAGNGGWFRISGSDMDIDQDGAADFDLNTVRAEAGFDVGFDNVFDRDWLVLGGFAGYGWSSAGFEGGSDVDFDIATLGAYATYFRGPYYLDALVKLDWLDGDYNSDHVSDDGDIELPVFGFSLETGYRFDLTQDGFYLRPQAQLSYAHAGSDSFTDDSGSRIELEDADSLRGRLGMRVGQELSTTAGAAAEPVKGTFYLEAAVNQEFLGEAEAKVSGLTLEQDLPGTTFEVGGGFDISLPKEGLSFTVDADYTFGDDADGIAATGGFRITW